MKACVLTTSYPRYEGDFSGIIIQDYARELSKKGIKINIVAPSGGDIKEKETLDNINIKRFNYAWPRKFQKLSYKGGFLPNLKRGFIGKLQLPMFILSFFINSLKESKNCDIIHAHWTLPGFIGVFIKKLRKKPLIISVRGSGTHSIKNKIARKLIRFAFMNSNLIILLSESLKKEVLSFKIPENKIKVINRGIRFDKFKPLNKNICRKKLNLPKNKKIILCIGRFVPIKNIPLLINAIKYVIKDVKNSLLIIMGEGHLKEDFIKIIKKNKLENNIIIKDNPKHNILPLYYNSCDIYVLPSLNEGFPITVLEAMSCKKPIIGSKVGGFLDIITKDTGILFNNKDEKELAKNIRYLLKNEKERKRLGENGFRRVRNLFSFEKEVDSLINTYKEFIRK